MTAADLDPCMREWLFAREALRRLGFTPDELFIVVVPNGQIVENGVKHDLKKPVLMLAVRAQGKEWKWTIGPTSLPLEQIEKHHGAAVEFWNTGADEAWLDQGWKTSMAFRMRIPLLMALGSKGFRLPNADTATFL